ncbi:uncharacterized protein TNCV_2088371 [Trichonephila clavipes]|nr:uncharacterized protein TNCV_2088371 [Trichonephila clavipes]
MAQRKHLGDFLRGRIIRRLECGRTQLEVSEELGIAQSVISRLSQRFQDDGNVSRCYSTGRPRVTTPNEDRYRIYRDVILEQHVRLFRGAMGAVFLFMDDNARPHCANIVDDCLQSEDITRMDWPAYSPDLNPIEHMCGICLADELQPVNPLPPVYLLWQTRTEWNEVVSDVFFTFGMMTQQTAPWENWHLERGFELLRTFGLVRWGLGGSGHVEGTGEKLSFASQVAR